MDKGDNVLESNFNPEMKKADFDNFFDSVLSYSNVDDKTSKTSKQWESQGLIPTFLEEGKHTKKLKIQIINKFDILNALNSPSFGEDLKVSPVDLNPYFN